MALTSMLPMRTTAAADPSIPSAITEPSEYASRDSVSRAPSWRAASSAAKAAAATCGSLSKEARTLAWPSRETMLRYCEPHGYEVVPPVDYEL